ncbi:hypothetical protein OKW41_000586 [Paraburkholderia sp. UCT70]
MTRPTDAAVNRMKSIERTSFFISTLERTRDVRMRTGS